MTINEVRQLENLNPIGAEGDQHYIQLNMQTLEDMDSEPQPEPAPATEETPPEPQEDAPQAEEGTDAVDG
jgi:hypothetical protein